MSERERGKRVGRERVTTKERLFVCWFVCLIVCLLVLCALSILHPTSCNCPPIIFHSLFKHRMPLSSSIGQKCTRGRKTPLPTWCACVFLLVHSPSSSSSPCCFLVFFFNIRLLDLSFQQSLGTGALATTIPLRHR